MHDIRFTPDELSTLREHGVVLFANRVIFDAQPPMPQAQIAAVQALCAGPIPGGLLALWEVTAGGQLDYDLSLEMNGNLEGISWTELFWNGSDSYHDLQGWIDHEQELAQEAAEESGEPWSGKLTHLPFGGFEYTDRIYAVVEPGAEHGQIVAWKKGLPPAWTHALHEDSVNTIASDLMSAFAALHLDEDPLAPTSDYFAGQTLLEYLDDRHEEHGLDLDLMDKLVAFYSRAVVDWRTPLAEGTLRHKPALARVALRHAIATDDAGLIARAWASTGRCRAARWQSMWRWGMAPSPPRRHWCAPARRWRPMRFATSTGRSHPNSRPRCWPTARSPTWRPSSSARPAVRPRART